MPTEPQTPTLSALVRRAVEIVDPEDVDGVLGDFEMRYEDADEPVTAIEDIEERVQFGADEDPAIQVAQAVVVYLAHRRDEVDDDSASIVRLAVRAEWSEDPPVEVANWLDSHGLEH